MSTKIAEFLTLAEQNELSGIDISISPYIGCDGQEKMVAFTDIDFLTYTKNYFDTSWEEAEAIIQKLADDWDYDDSMTYCCECGVAIPYECGITHNYQVFGCELFGLSCGCANDKFVELLEAQDTNVVITGKDVKEIEFGNRKELTLYLGDIERVKEKLQIKQVAEISVDWENGIKLNTDKEIDDNKKYFFELTSIGQWEKEIAVYELV